MKFFLRFFLSVIFLNAAALAGDGFSHGISTFGDLKYSKNFKHFDYVNPNAPKGGEVKFGVEGGFNNLNQFILKGLSASGLSYLYDSLMEGSEDEISARYGLVAEAVKLAEDKMSIEFALRQNAQFHDGKKITADDVVFTFNKLISDGHPSYKMAFRDVKEVKKINDHLVKFYFKNNHNRDLPILVSSLPVLPKHFYEKNDFSKTTLTPPLGSGPYKIKEVKQNRSIVFERVKNYWAADLPVNRGRYNFDQITFDYYRDNNVLVEAFKSQKYDLRQENVARNWANSYNIDAVKNGEILKKEIAHQLPAPMQTFVMNLRREKFQSLALRKAVTLAFDFEWLRDHIFYGSYKRTESYFANSDFGYKNFHLPKSNGDGFNRYNLLEAKKILDEAGYKLVDDVLVDGKSGEKISIEIIIDSEAFEMIAAPFVKNLRKLGIDAKMRFIEENQYQTRVNNFDFDVIVAMFGQALIPGDELFSYFHSSQKDVKGGRNLIGLNDKIIDDFVEKISRAKTKIELKNLCQKLDQRMLENYYTAPQWHSNTYRILYRNIFAVPSLQPKYSLATDTWWLKNQK
ncbi:MAG: ABC transporter substrate-binding protein [Rickettsiales bacterium]|nr:ABC transporter substrate-binding protein [Rickettsiales bacterium]